MVQGNLKLFQADYRAIAEAMKHEKALLSESLSSEQNPQDREQSTLEMRQQLKEIQEEREQQNSEIQALKEQLRELLLAREEPAQTHRDQTLPSTPKSPNTGSQHPPLSADSERPDPDSSQRPLSGSPAQQHQPSSHSSPEEPEPTPHLEPRPEHRPEPHRPELHTDLQRPERIRTDRDCPITAPTLQRLKPVHSRARPSQTDRATPSCQRRSEPS
ncbi:hypothetical protein G5714_009698 [Onychostoma macrolepis]|uniref:Uncharacterized protein n=1 Tax=Onychostoma macrolepis TaxID=369639 RepID=A0A7J6CT18_9TELE|nr:hypothetical protein G5714_009698 [Onychostoma macrolepis]